MVNSLPPLKKFTGLLGLLCLFISVSNSLHATETKSISAQDCVGCHKQAVHDWEQSDHFKSMDHATDETVIADFNNAEITNFSQKGKFYRKGKEFWATIEHQNKTTNHKIDYVFGYWPLQQFLVDTGDGHMQVLPYTWDSRPKEENGQRWYAIFDNEDIKAEDRLHWLQPMQNWNGMCADCHSDGLKRNFKLADNSFDTQWDNINVGCQSCHGKMPEHLAKPVKVSPPRQSEKLNAWVLNVGEKNAKWLGDKRDNSFMDNCYACHSLRSPLTDGIEPNTPFLDQFAPSFIHRPLYYADGQIKEEVYVYGSFMQSKMAKAGVNCIDCHDKHTMKIKAQDNSLCLQCHNAEVFQQKTHHGHEPTSKGSECVECHMPETRYMGVDDRRDHGFSIPRPHLTDQDKTKNVCTGCHEDKTNGWATKSLAKLHGKAKPQSINEQNFIKIQNGYSLTLSEHFAVINDETISGIARATAVAALANVTNQLTDVTIKPWVTSSEPLIRLALASIGNSIAPVERNKSFLLLINDQYKAVRVAAANHLINNPNIDKKVLAKVFTELNTANDINTWRGEGNLNNSLVHLGMGRTDKAISSLISAIEVDPYFDAAYINLADLYRNQGNTKAEEKTLIAGVKAVPISAMLHYGHGFYLIRDKQKAAAVKAFHEATKLAPDNSRYMYIYLLAKDSIGQTKQALAQLKMVMARFKHDQQLAQLGMSMSKKLADQESYKFFSQYIYN